MPSPTYATRADLLARIGAKRLRQLADLDNDGVEDSGRVDLALLDAEAEINSYARLCFAVPFDPVPDTIKRMTMRLAVYNMKVEKGNPSPTEADELHHEQDLAWLKALAEGKVDPGTTNTPSASPRNRAGYSGRPSSKKVSRDKLKGFW